MSTYNLSSATIAAVQGFYLIKTTPLRIEPFAMISARGPMSQDHKVGELTEILRMIEAAAKNGVLVLATTNRKEALDPAVLRTGRFDHQVLVDYPTEEEVELAMRGMLKDRPHDVFDLSAVSRSLSRRPMSDAAWVVNEAARLTARAKQDRITSDVVQQALKRLSIRVGSK